MSEFWYRGEGMSVEPASAGSVLNDIGDGMYLTDKIEVANRYAVERANRIEDRRVYSVKLSAVGMRVLDLTIDPRWQKHIRNPPIIEFQLKSGTASQYSQHFKNFLRANNINLADYDAVIGYEYRLGGKQMCILYKNGQPSSVQIKLRNQFVPVGPKPVPKSPIGRLRFGGKIGPGLRIAGGTLLQIAAVLLLNWLASKFIQKVSEDHFKKQIEAFQPEIEATVRRKKHTALKLLADGKEVFATIRVEALIMTTITEDGPIDSLPYVKLLNLQITDKEENKPDGEETSSSFPISETRNFYKMSFRLTYSEQEIDLFRAYLKEIEWYETKIKTAPSAQDVTRLNQDRNDLIKQLNKAMED